MGGVRWDGLVASVENTRMRIQGQTDGRFSLKSERMTRQSRRTPPDLIHTRPSAEHTNETNPTPHGDEVLLANRCNCSQTDVMAAQLGSVAITSDGSVLISTCAGVDQGDAASTLLFAIVAQLLIDETREACPRLFKGLQYAFYGDDGIIVVPMSNLNTGLQFAQAISDRAAADFGLDTSLSKSFVVVTNSADAGKVERYLNLQHKGNLGALSVKNVASQAIKSLNVPISLDSAACGPLYEPLVADCQRLIDTAHALLGVRHPTLFARFLRYNVQSRAGYLSRGTILGAEPLQFALQRVDELVRTAFWQQLGIDDSIPLPATAIPELIELPVREWGGGLVFPALRIFSSPLSSVH